MHHGDAQPVIAATEGAFDMSFSNVTGGDPRPVAAELPDRLVCRCAIAMAVPEPCADQKNLQRFQTLGIYLAAPGRAGWADAVRILIVSRQGGETRVQTYGNPLPAEDDDDPRPLGSTTWIAICVLLRTTRSALRPTSPGGKRATDPEP